MIELLNKVKANNFTLGVVGIGRVGLPLGLMFANRGVHVIGIDANKDYVEKIQSGKFPFKENNYEKFFPNKNFSATADTAAGIQKSDVIILTIGTPIADHMRLDYSQLYSALDGIVKVSLKGKMIIMRSTAARRTLKKTIKRYIEKRTGLKAGKDFTLAVCPERIIEGRAFEELETLPEIVGGIDETASQIAAEIFKKINPNKKILITSPTAAELAKLYTNVYRYVNFALGNEFGLIAEEYGEDAHEIIKILNDGYPRGGVRIPGMTGGPCLSKDGYYLTHNMLYPDFILTAWRLNESMPAYIIGRMKKELEQRGKKVSDCKIAVLGLAFKGGSDDTRYSPSLRIVEILKGNNADVSVHDPHIEGTEKIEKAIENADAIIVATNHPEFKDAHKLIANLKKHKPDCVLVDCWGMFDSAEAKQLGFGYIRFGSGRK